MKILIMSDIHGNKEAFQAVLVSVAERHDIKECVLLGDLIDYGMQSNEVVNFLENRFDYKIVCSIWGNHERAIMTSDFTNFSSTSMTAFHPKEERSVRNTQRADSQRSQCNT